MKIGLYVTTLNPAGASQARFQAAVFEGLRRHAGSRHEFVVLSHSDPNGFENGDRFTYVRVRTAPRETGLYSRLGQALSRLTGGHGTPIARSLNRRPSQDEPAYYQQLRDLGIRLLWYVNPHELSSWLPFVKTVWDVNHRIHSMYPEFSYTRFKFDALDTPAASMARASYIITGTQEGKRQIVSMFGVYPDKVRVIPFPTPLLPPVDDVEMPTLAFKHDAPYVFYPARFWPHKNHVVLVAALKVLRDRWNVTINAVLSGADEGNLAHVLNYAEELGVRDQIVYVGNTTDAHMASLYKGALALAFVAAVGPDNLPPLEAMSLGCPAIVADVPGAREQYGDACLFFEPTDEVTLACEIRSLLQDSTARERLITRGFARSAQWSVSDYAAAVTKIFDEFELVARAWGRSDAVFT